MLLLQAFDPGAGGIVSVSNLYPGQRAFQYSFEYTKVYLYYFLKLKNIWFCTITLEMTLQFKYVKYI